jgi:hypothetical protein
VNRAAVLTDSIDRYAELCAQLDDAFAPRAAILGSVGLDEQAWTGLTAQWAGRLCAGDGGVFAQRFGDVYAATRCRMLAPKQRGAAQPDSRFLSTEEQPWRAEAARVSLDMPALPFRPARADEASGVRLAPAPRRIHEPPIRPEPTTAESTTEVPIFAEQQPVLPFEPARVPYRRLHRFDTQTGLPLPSPIWIDETAADPNKSA